MWNPIYAFQLWRMRRWMRGKCYICQRDCETRIVAYRSGDPPVSVDMHACPDHFADVRDYAQAAIRGPVDE